MYTRLRTYGIGYKIRRAAQSAFYRLHAIAIH